MHGFVWKACTLTQYFFFKSNGKTKAQERRDTTQNSPVFETSNKWTLVLPVHVDDIQICSCPSLGSGVGRFCDQTCAGVLVFFDCIFLNNPQKHFNMFFFQTEAQQKLERQESNGCSIVPKIYACAGCTFLVTIGWKYPESHWDNWHKFKFPVLMQSRHQDKNAIQDKLLVCSSTRRAIRFYDFWRKYQRAFSWYGIGFSVYLQIRELFMDLWCVRMHAYRRAAAEEGQMFTWSETPTLIWLWWPVALLYQGERRGAGGGGFTEISVALFFCCGGLMQSFFQTGLHCVFQFVILSTAASLAQSELKLRQLRWKPQSSTAFWTFMNS